MLCTCFCGGQGSRSGSDLQPDRNWKTRNCDIFRAKSSRIRRKNAKFVFFTVAFQFLFIYRHKIHGHIMPYQLQNIALRYFPDKVIKKQAKECEFRFFLLLHFSLFSLTDKKSMVKFWCRGYRNLASILFVYCPIPPDRPDGHKCDSIRS